MRLGVVVAVDLEEQAPAQRAPEEGSTGIDAGPFDVARLAPFGGALAVPAPVQMIVKIHDNLLCARV